MITRNQQLLAVTATLLEKTAFAKGGPCYVQKKNTTGKELQGQRLILFFMRVSGVLALGLRGMWTES